ncbi:MAG TPA: lytic transglycosylase domain-containing protein [Candidatus Binataceae bacterium]|nr:lytic transglycosylase domain-containing protein [Candidatus Binataceae bacterium]
MRRGRNLNPDRRILSLEAVDKRASHPAGGAHATLILFSMIAFAAISPLRAAHAADVSVPITIDYLTLGAALKAQIYTAPGGKAALWNGADQCQFFYAEDPAFSSASPRLRLETAASFGLGVALGERCVSPIAWSGIAEAESSPYIAPGLRLKIRITDVNLYNAAHQKTLVAGKGFDLIKQYLIPELETFTYDLNPAIQQLGALAEEAAAPDIAPRIRAAISTVRAEPQIQVLAQGIRITLVITMPDLPAPAASATPGEPTPAELAAFQKQLNQWDAFLVFAIKQLGANVGDQRFRDQLMQILIESRYRLVDALAKPPSAAGPDPVRTLFLDTWQELGVAVHDAGARGQLGAQGLQFLSFISAGDALFALDQAAPALGIRVSAEDLRRLAHIMAPNVTGDPLQFNFDEDQSLKRMFGVTEPLSSPLSSSPDETGDLSSATPESSPVPAPSPVATFSESDLGPSAATPLPSATPTPRPPLAAASLTPTVAAAAATPTAPLPTPAAPQPAPTAVSPPSAPHAAAGPWLRIPLWLIEPTEASAAEPGIVPELAQIAQRLRRVVVNQSNAQPYRQTMEQLLTLSTEREIADSNLAPRYRATFRLLVKSAAWQESCWRQFVRVNDRVTWLESSTGDIGLMQVNKHVWRGFYSVDKLRWDVLYNAGAGTEILGEMLRTVAAKPHIDPIRDNTHALARSAYAAYNGGPDAYNRWRTPGRERRLARAIDAAYEKKLRAVERGDQINILSCEQEWGHPSAQ